MRQIFIYIATILVIQACSSKKSNQPSNVNSEELEVICMPNDYRYETNIDSIFKEVEYIPLETSKNCLLVNPRKAMYRNNKYYILDFRRGLYVFENNGTFLHQIGRIGRGPGEIMDFNDFDFDEQGNVLILDYKQIHRYNPEGNYIDTYTRFDFMEEGFYANLYQFVFMSPHKFYMWGGTLGIKNQVENHYAMYMMDKSKLVKQFFPLKYKLSDKQHRFLRSGTEILINPVLGNDTIYSIRGENVFAKYFVEFRHGIKNNTIPNKMNSLSDFGYGILNNNKVSYNIMNPLETQNWLSFTFTHKKSRVIAMYRKNTKEIYTIKGFDLNGKKSTILMPYYFHFMHDDYFCSIVSAKQFMTICDGINNSDSLTKCLNPNNKIVTQDDNFVIVKYKPINN